MSQSTVNTRSGASAMEAAPAKTGSGPIGVLGPVLAVLLLALGAFLLRDALVRAGALSGSDWTNGLIEGVRGFAPATWLVPVGIVVALVGLWVLVTALRPRSRNTLPLTSRTGVHLHTRDVARLASGAAQDVDGVLSVSSSATRHKLEVSVESTGGEGVRQAVSTVVAERLSALQNPPRTTVRVRAPKENS